MDRVEAGEADTEPKAKGKAAEAAKPVAPADVGEVPPASLFILDMPTSALMNCACHGRRPR